MHEINKRKALEELMGFGGLECVRRRNWLKGIRAALGSRFVREKCASRTELDLQQNSLISGCTCSTIGLPLRHSPSSSGKRAGEESKKRNCDSAEAGPGGKKKSVISNFLIVIGVRFSAAAALCLRVCGSVRRLRLSFFYDLFMKFSLAGHLRALLCLLARLLRINSMAFLESVQCRNGKSGRRYSPAT
jgi:hypothetical protein